MNRGYIEEEAELLTGDDDFYKKAIIALEKLRQHGYDPELRVERVEP